MKKLSFVFGSLLSAAFLIGFAGCGVKGKPLPPEEPVPIGHGQDARPEDVMPAGTKTTLAPVKPAAATQETSKKTPAKSKKKQ